ncbi:MAG: DUF1730 domain-containing protein [Thermoguttaceae bacterium]|nr:DUF1730 domain-containing protein [Thermoguttaceae bacterium]
MSKEFRRLAVPEPLRDTARALGFPLLGAVEAGESEFFPEFQAWLEAGKCAGMAYLREHADARRQPESVLPGVRSILMLGMPFGELEKLAEREYPGHPIRHCLARQTPENTASEPPKNTAFVAQYAASGLDYHDIIRRQLKTLQKTFREFFPNQTSRGIVDTAPFFEREFAVRAGLGFLGRNRMLIHPDFGSLFFLAAILTTETLPETAEPPSTPLLTREEQLEFRRRCETCGQCLRACPTGALSETGLDARLCASYLTIEDRSSEGSSTPIPSPYLLGCDECQRHCPWNQPFPPRTLFRLDAFPLTADTLRRTPFSRPGPEKLEARAAELGK